VSAFGKHDRTPRLTKKATTQDLGHPFKNASHNVALDIRTRGSDADKEEMLRFASVGGAEVCRRWAQIYYEMSTQVLQTLKRNL